VASAELAQVNALAAPAVAYANQRGFVITAGFLEWVRFGFMIKPKVLNACSRCREKLGVGLRGKEKPAQKRAKLQKACSSEENAAQKAGVNV
jgi:hypothetical protein